MQPVRRRAPHRAPTTGPATSPGPSPAANRVPAGHTPCPSHEQACDTSLPARGEVLLSSRPARRSARAGAEICGEVLLTLARLRCATPDQLRRLLLPHQAGTDYVRRALRNLAAESPALVGRVQRAQQSIWFCTRSGLAEATASGLLPPTTRRTTGRKAAAKTGLREHALALVDAVLALHLTGDADHSDWQIEAAHLTVGTLVADAVVLLTSGWHAFVELDRATTSYARLLARLDRYDVYRTAPPTGRGSAARAPRNHGQDHYRAPDSVYNRFPPVLLVFAPAPRRADPATREAEFLTRAAHYPAVWSRRIVVATATLPRLSTTAEPAAWMAALSPESYRTLDDLPASSTW